MKKIIILLSTIAISVNAQTIKISHTTQFAKCSLIENKIKSFVKPYKDNFYKGYTVGYSFLGADIISKMIVSEEPKSYLLVDQSPNLQQTQHGCFVSFKLSTSEGRTLYKPSIEMRTGPRKGFIAAQIAND